MYSNRVHLSAGPGPGPARQGFPSQPDTLDDNTALSQPYDHPQHPSGVYYGPTHDMYGSSYTGEGWTQLGVDGFGGGWPGAGNAGAADWHQQAIIHHRQQAHDHQQPQWGIQDWDYQQGKLNKSLADCHHWRVAG